ncbi:MAG: RHS repeat protein, partial [Candidatus Thiodiazotropha sp.]
MPMFTAKLTSPAVALSAVLGLLVVTTAQATERTVSYTYNDLGLVTSLDGPRTDVADVTTYDYDSQGNRIRITNALGHTTQITAYDAAGRPLTSVDPNGLVTNMEYDLRGRLTRLDRGGEVTLLGYDAVGNLTSVTRPDGSAMQMHYDAANRLVGVEDADGNRIQYTLDAMGNRTRVEVQDATGQLVKLQRSVFDELSRLLQSIGASEQLTQYRYDANDNRTGLIDANGNATGYAYDALNRLVSTTDPLGGSVAYGYDAQDHLTSVTDPNGNTTTYVYDGLGNLIEQHSPDTGTTTYTHDEAGNVLSKTDAKGQTTTYQYDALNRLTHTRYADGSDVTYDYDTAENGIGRLASVSDPNGQTTWRYDPHGRVVTRTQSVPGDSVTTELTTAYHYNAVGQLSGMTYPSGLQVDYRYADGKLNAVSLNGSPLLSAISYQAFGPVSGWQWSNGSQSVRGYDLDGRLIRQTLGSATRQLVYDADGNITGITDPADSQSFGYDPLNRLNTAAANAYHLNWEYDANGNRLSQTTTEATTAYSIESGSNRLIDVGGTA